MLISIGTINHSEPRHFKGYTHKNTGENMRKIKYSTKLYKKCTTGLWVSLLFVLLSGCNPPPEPLEHSSDFPFSITWQPDQPRAEQPIEFRLMLPPDVQPLVSEVRGVTMYMGTIPVQWRFAEVGHWQATLLVGACSEPVMEWQLTIPLRWAAETEQRPMPQPLRVNFVTSNNER